MAPTTVILATYTGENFAVGVAKIDRGISVATWAHIDGDLFEADFIPIRIFLDENSAHVYAAEVAAK